MAGQAAPPAKGTYVEIWHLNVCVAGHVRWAHGGRFGILSHEKIDTSVLLSGNPTRQALIGGKRRSGSQLPLNSRTQLDVALTADASRKFALIFDWVSVAFVGAVVASLLVTAVNAALKEPQQKVQSALRASHESLR